MADLIVAVDQVSILKFLKKRKKCETINYFLCTDSSYYGDIIYDNGNYFIHNQNYFKEPDLFEHFDLLLRKTRTQLQKYDLGIQLEIGLLDLTDSIITDCSYEISPLIGIVEKILSLNSTFSFKKIIILSNISNFSIIISTLKKLKLQVNNNYKHEPNVLMLFLQRLRLIIKGVYIVFFLKNKCRNINGKILAYVKPYYYNKIEHTMRSGSLNAYIVNGVTTRDQLYEMFCKSNFNLMSISGLFKKVKRIHKNNSNILSDPFSIIVDRLIFKYFTKAQLLTNSVYFKIKTANPKAVWLTNPSFMEAGVLILLCKKLGITTFLLNGGAFSIPFQYTLPAVDKFLVWGEFYKDILLKENIPEKNIIITGTPFLEIPKKRVVKKEIKNIGIISGGFPKRYGNDHWKIIAEGIRNFAKIEFTIRPHPLENKAEFQAVLNKWFKNINYKIDKSGDLKDILGNSDLIIHQNSTVGIEAIIEGIPVINIKSINTIYNAPYNAFTIPVEVTNEVKLIEALEFYLKDSNWINEFLKNREDFLNKMYFKTGVNAVEELLEQFKTK